MDQEHGPPSWNRRQFIKGTSTLMGTLPFANAISGCGSEEEPQDKLAQDGALLEAQSSSASSSVQVSLVVNGVARSVTVEPRVTLNEVLRYDLGLVGTRLGCDRAACGACTVLVDGKAVYSCTTLAVEAGGRQVTTIEGLATGSSLDPIQAAFIEQDALQCGFCTSGMIMSCKSLLNSNLNPSEQDVKVATAGNLCRCGTYPRVFKACQQAAEQLRGG